MSVFQEVVTAHHAESQAILVATSEPCISLAYDEKANVPGRSFQIIEPEELGDLRLRKSWLMAVILCPGDETKAVAAWAQAGRRDERRIIFYFPEGTEVQEVLRAWNDHSLPLYATWTIRTWRDFHRHFGAAWNVRIFDDFR